MSPQVQSLLIKTHAAADTQWDHSETIGSVPRSCMLFMPPRQKQPGAPGALNLATVHPMAKTLTSPGEVVSADQLESNVAGLIAQMAGCPTIQR